MNYLPAAGVVILKEHEDGDHDDLVDSTTQAIMRFRDGGLINHPDDYKEEAKPKKRYKYYW